MKKQTIVKYKVNRNGIVEVLKIGNSKCQKNEVLYFDLEDFYSNISELVELVTGQTEFTMKKVLFF